MIGARGEVELVIDGARRTLCLTLGALAELESLFECHTISQLQARLRTLSANDVRSVLQILLKTDGGACSVDGVSPKDAARAIAETFNAALG